MITMQIDESKLSDHAIELIDELVDELGYDPAPQIKAKQEWTVEEILMREG